MKYRILQSEDGTYSQWWIQRKRLLFWHYFKHMPAAKTIPKRFTTFGDAGEQIRGWCQERQRRKNERAKHVEWTGTCKDLEVEE